jgi:hypothetical protein
VDDLNVVTLAPHSIHFLQARKATQHESADGLPDATLPQLLAALQHVRLLLLLPYSALAMA